MKTKNVKVRAKDIRQGRVAYVAHPVYGIDKVTFLDIPRYSKVLPDSLFVKCRTHHPKGHGFYESRRSICDMGITALYNGRRTFWKRKHAEAWVKKWSTDKGFIQQHAEHEEFCAAMDDYCYYD